MPKTGLPNESETEEKFSGEAVPRSTPMPLVIQRLRQGRLLTELHSELQRVVKAIAETTTMKAGQVTLTIDIAPAKQKRNVVIIRGTVKGKCPEDPPDTDLFFFDEEGDLFDRDPMQSDLVDGLRGLE